MVGRRLRLLSTSDRAIKVILERYAHVVRRSRRLDFSFVDDLES